MTKLVHLPRQARVINITQSYPASSNSKLAASNPIKASDDQSNASFNQHVTKPETISDPSLNEINTGSKPAVSVLKLKQDNDVKPEQITTFSVIYPSRSLVDKIEKSKLRVLSAIAKPPKKTVQPAARLQTLDGIFQTSPPLTIDITADVTTIDDTEEPRIPEVAHFDSLEAPGPDDPKLSSDSTQGIRNAEGSSLGDAFIGTHFESLFIYILWCPNFNSW